MRRPCIHDATLLPAWPHQLSPSCAAHTLQVAPGRSLQQQPSIPDARLTGSMDDAQPIQLCLQAQLEDRERVVAGRQRREVGVGPHGGASLGIIHGRDKGRGV
eukprot:7385365-Prymnesium_polylepis.1